jgi:hypothetical protein
MTIAVLRQNGDLIWFDAITQFSERYTGSLSAHPLESGNVVNDHTTINNLEISLQGIVSDADFNLDRPTITEDDTRDWKINNKQFVNNSPVTTEVTIDYKPGLSKFLPESVGQFLTPTVPTVTVPAFDRPKFAARIKDELIAIQVKAENFSLVDFQQGRIWRVLDNCVLTGLDFTETPDSGDAIYPNMTIVQARYATTATATVPKQAKKGRQSGKTTERETEPTNDGTDGGPTNYSEKSVLLSGKEKALSYETPENINKAGR